MKIMTSVASKKPDMPQNANALCIVQLNISMQHENNDPFINLNPTKLSQIMHFHRHLVLLSHFDGASGGMRREETDFHKSPTRINLINCSD